MIEQKELSGILKLQKHMGLRSCCNFDTVTPHLNAQIDALLQERDVLAKALRTTFKLLDNPHQQRCVIKSKVLPILNQGRKNEKEEKSWEEKES